MDVQLTNDCGCCGSDCAKQCQYMSGTATLHGFRSWTDPLRVYKKWAMEGSGTTWSVTYDSKIVDWYYDGPGETLDPVTLTKSGYVRFNDSNGNHPIMRYSTDHNIVVDDAVPNVIRGPINHSVSRSLDRSTYAYDTTPVYGGVYHDWRKNMAAGEVVTTLSEEDTEADAIARAKAAGGTWQHQTGYSCLGLASYQTSRGNGYTWDWVQVQHRTEVPAYDPKHPDQTYDVYLWWYTTAGGAGAAIVSEGYSFVNFKPDSVNTTTLWYDIPIPEVGLFAYSGICKVRAA